VFILRSFPRKSILGGFGHGWKDRLWREALDFFRMSLLEMNHSGNREHRKRHQQGDDSADQEPGLHTQVICYLNFIFVNIIVNYIKYKSLLIEY